MTLQRAMFALVLALYAPAHAQQPSSDAGERLARPELIKLERSRDRRPHDYERREALALAYYRVARAALDRGDATEYAQFLDLAEREWMVGLELEPRSARALTYMGMIAAYRGRIDRTLESMVEARKAEPKDPLSYANVAAAMTYAGSERGEIEEWLARGEKLGVAPELLEFRRCMLRWRDGDTEAAARSLYQALELEPEIGAIWNEAPVPRPIRTFEAFTNYCCASPACGPYMAEPCARADAEIRALDLPVERALRELRDEMARARGSRPSESAARGDGAESASGSMPDVEDRQARDVRIRLKDETLDPNRPLPGSDGRKELDREATRQKRESE